MTCEIIGNLKNFMAAIFLSASPEVAAQVSEKYKIHAKFIQAVLKKYLYMCGCIKITDGNDRPVVDTHSGIREMLLFPGSQLDCGVSVLPEQFLPLQFAVTPSPDGA